MGTVVCTLFGHEYHVVDKYPTAGANKYVLICKCCGRVKKVTS